MRPWALLGDPYGVAFLNGILPLAARTFPGQLGLLPEGQKILDILAARGLNVPTCVSKLTYSTGQRCARSLGDTNPKRERGSQELGACPKTLTPALSQKERGTLSRDSSSESKIEP